MTFTAMCWFIGAFFALAVQHYGWKHGIVAVAFSGFCCAAWLGLLHLIGFYR